MRAGLQSASHELTDTTHCRWKPALLQPPAWALFRAWFRMR